MIDKERFLIYPMSKAELENHRGEIPPYIIENYEKKVPEMFPRFSETFPNTANAMSLLWGGASLGFKIIEKTNLYTLVFEGLETNLFFKITGRTEETPDLTLDETRRMLPASWKELYRQFDSFVVTSKSTAPNSWIGTPFAHSRRLDIEEYCKWANLRKSKSKSIVSQLDSDMLCCWLLAPNGDALFVDERRCDKKVYLVNLFKSEKARLLLDPHTALDKYMADYISGNPSKDFPWEDFM